MKCAQVRVLSKSILLAGAASWAMITSYGAARAEDPAAALRREIRAMEDRLARIEVGRAEIDGKRRVAAAAAVEAGDKPRSWKLPGTNTSMNIGGFVKMSVLWDFSVARQTSGMTTSEGSGAGGTTVVDGSQGDNVFNGGNFQLTARRSRFWIQTWTPTDWGEFRTYIEGDFAAAGTISGGAVPGSNGNLLRLRQAFGTLGPVLIGKTQTLFFGQIGFPERLDEAPIKPGDQRIEQIRYSHNFGGGVTLSVALEDAGNTSAAAACRRPRTRICASPGATASTAGPSTPRAASCCATMAWPCRSAPANMTCCWRSSSGPSAR
jgi:hypothetical protein